MAPSSTPHGLEINVLDLSTQYSDKRRVIMTVEVRWRFRIWQSLWCAKLRKCSHWARMDDANAKSHRLWQL